MAFRSNVYIIKEDNWYVANSIETGIASQGKSIEEAINNLKEALELYFEDNNEEKNLTPTYLTQLEVIV